MSSCADVPPSRPRICLIPPATRSDADDAAFLSSAYGLTPDPWQYQILEGWLGFRADGRLAAPRCGLALARQNGKNGCLEVAELFKMVSQGRRVLHTAHEVKTARKAFLRLLGFFDNPVKFPELRATVKEIRRTNGQEAIFLLNGGSVEFIARSKGSGRGFSVDDLVLDEAQELTEEQLAALLPTISASADPQQIMTGTPPGPATSGEVFARVRLEGLKGQIGRLCWIEYGCTDDDDLDDTDAWHRANPALGIRLHLDTIVDERAAMAAGTFARERMGVWGESKHAAVIDSDVWAALAHPQSQIVGAPAYAVDVSPDGAWASIAAAGRTTAGLDHVEAVEHAPGVDWVVARLAGMVSRKAPCAVVLDGASLAASLLPALREAGLDPVVTSAREMAQACGGFYTAAVTGQLRHLDYKALNAAVAVARRRDLGTEGAWAWARKGQADITPLVAVTLARYGHAVHGLKRSSVYDRRGMVSL